MSSSEVGGYYRIYIYSKHVLITICVTSITNSVADTKLLMNGEVEAISNTLVLLLKKI